MIRVVLYFEGKLLAWTAVVMAFVLVFMKPVHHRLNSESHLL